MGTHSLCWKFKVDIPYLDILILIYTPKVEWHMWLGVAPRTDIEKPMYLKESGLRAKNMKAIRGSIVNLIEGTYMTIQEA